MTRIRPQRPFLPAADMVMLHFAGVVDRQNHLRVLVSIALPLVSMWTFAQDGLPTPPPNDVSPSLGAKTKELLADPPLLLRFLQSRDEQFDNMSIETELKWTDHIGPRQSELLELPTSPLPEPYDQPHRVRYVLTVRGLQTTLQTTGELDPILHPEFTYCESRNLKQTNVTGSDCEYTEAEGGSESYYYENPIAGKGLLAYRRMRIEFAHGYGYAKHFSSIDSCRIGDDVVYISGPFHIGDNDNSYGSLELDHKYIVRKATITRRENGKELRITVETSGSKAIDVALSIATAGHFLHTITFPTKPDEPPLVATRNNDHYSFISISRNLSDGVYSEITTIKKDHSTIDISPNRKRNAALRAGRNQSQLLIGLVIANLLVIILLVIWNTMRARPQKSGPSPASESGPG